MLSLILAMSVTSTDPVAWLVNAGVAGVVVALIALGILRTKWEVGSIEKAHGEQVATMQKVLDERGAQILAKDIALQALYTQLTQHTLPQMADTARLVQDLPPSHEDEILRTLAEMSRRLDDLQQGGDHAQH